MNILSKIELYISFEVKLLYSVTVNVLEETSAASVIAYFDIPKMCIIVQQTSVLINSSVLLEALRSTYHVTS